MSARPSQPGCCGRLAGCQAPKRLLPVHGCVGVSQRPRLGGCRRLPRSTGGSCANRCRNDRQERGGSAGWSPWLLVPLREPHAAEGDCELVPTSLIRPFCFCCDPLQLQARLFFKKAVGDYCACLRAKVSRALSPNFCDTRRFATPRVLASPPPSALAPSPPLLPECDPSASEQSARFLRGVVVAWTAYGVKVARLAPALCPECCCPMWRARMPRRR